MRSDSDAMDPADPNIGRRIGGRFVVEAPLGVGGMGSLYRGRDDRPPLRGVAAQPQDVAIKLLKRALWDDAVLRERFRREALSLAKLRHPGIVTLLDFGEVDGEPYTVLELVRGRTLEDVLRTGGGMSIHRASPIFSRILDALDVCHAHSIVHRDIKPSNLMISARDDDGHAADHVTIIDFGLARIAPSGAGSLETLTETGTVQGTPHYMAPEQCRGEEVGPPADVYAAAVVFYEMLAGAPPFLGRDAATFMAQHLFVEAPALRSVAPDVSDGVAAAIHAALAKREADRPTARELKTALEAALEGNDPQTRAAHATAERRIASGLPRTERVLARPPAATASPLDEHRVIVWLPNDARSARLRGCLGTAGLACTLWSEEAPPELPAASPVVVVTHGRALARVAALRRSAPKVPIVIVDVERPEDTTAAIRAGASDMLLALAPDADLVPKVRRLLARSGARR